MKHLAVLLVAVSLTLHVDHLVLSPNAESAFATWLDADGPWPSGFFGPGSRRFGPTVITYRVLQPGSRQAAYVPDAVRFWGYIFQGLIQFVAVPASDETAMITVEHRSSFELPPWIPRVSVNCGLSPLEMEDDRVTIRRAWVLSATGKSGCESRRIVIHEFGHVVITTNMLHPERGIMSKNCGGCPDWNNAMTPEQNAAKSGWEGVPGLFEAARWIYQHGPGNVP